MKLRRNDMSAVYLQSLGLMHHCKAMLLYLRHGIERCARGINVKSFFLAGLPSSAAKDCGRQHLQLPSATLTVYLFKTWLSFPSRTTWRSSAAATFLFSRYYKSNWHKHILAKVLLKLLGNFSLLVSNVQRKLRWHANSFIDRPCPM